MFQYTNFSPFTSQFQFLDLSVILAVQTRGTASSAYIRWITEFRLELSYDCATFRPLVDASGSNLVIITVQLCYELVYTWNKTMQFIKFDKQR